MDEFIFEAHARWAGAAGQAFSVEVKI